MPQFGWFEILIVLVIAVLIIGPKDFPIVLKKIGKWTSSIKRYFNDIQKDITNLKEFEDDENSLEKKYSNKNKKDKDE